MKQHRLLTALAALAACATLGHAQINLQNDPAYLPIDQVLDFKIVKPEVSVNLPRFLLLDAASEFDGGPNDPLAKTGVNFKELVSDIKLIRFVVIEANDQTRAHVEKAVATLRKQVEASWVPIVSVPDDNVGVYALGDPSGEKMAGLALLIYDNGSAVIGNIVGRVSVGKVLKIATQINAVPKDLLDKLSGVGRHSEKSSAKSASDKSENPTTPAEKKTEQ